MDKCPECGSPVTSQDTAWQIFACGAQRNIHSGHFLEHLGCMTNQRDQLQASADALAEELKQTVAMLTDDFVAHAEIVEGIPTPMYGLETIRARVESINAVLSAYRAATKG